jgi:hypothetical protein
LEAVRADILLPLSRHSFCTRPGRLIRRKLWTRCPSASRPEKTARRCTTSANVSRSYGPEFAAWLGELARVRIPWDRSRFTAPD